MDEKLIKKAMVLINNCIDVQEKSKRITHANISAINEDIKAYKIAIEALEKQLPKRVDFEEDVAENMCVECPSCGSFLGYQVDCLDENYQFNYCEHCGQRLDW